MNCPICGFELNDGEFCNNCNEQQHVDANVQIADDTVDMQNNMLTDLAEAQPFAPEYALLWSLLLPPIAGAIIWTKNWKRLGQRNRIAMTWATAIGIICIPIFFGFVPLVLFLEVVASVGWSIWHYLNQRKVIPAELRSKKARNILIIGVSLLVIGCLLYGMLDAIIESIPTIEIPTASVTFGSSIDDSSRDQPVSGDDFGVKKMFYIRISSPKPFGTATITEITEIQLENGEWTPFFEKTYTIHDQYVHVFTFKPGRTANFRFRFLNDDGNLFAERSISITR